MLSYPTEISKDGDFFLVSLRYFYGEEPVTQGKKYEEALAMAADWLLSVATIAKENKMSSKAFYRQKRRSFN